MVALVTIVCFVDVARNCAAKKYWNCILWMLISSINQFMQLKLIDGMIAGDVLAIIKNKIELLSTKIEPLPKTSKYKMKFYFEGNELLPRLGFWILLRIFQFQNVVANTKHPIVNDGQNTSSNLGHVEQAEKDGNSNFFDVKGASLKKIDHDHSTYPNSHIPQTTTYWITSMAWIHHPLKSRP